MNRPTSPPTMDLFQRTRDPLGSAEMALAMGRLRLGLSGLDDDLAGRMGERFGVYVTALEDSDVALRLAARAEERAYFIDPPERAEFNPVLIACDGPQVRYLGYRVAGWFDVGPGRGEFLLARGTIEPSHRAVENYVRAAVAWYAAHLGGALIHAASAVLDGKGFLFYGESGAGKSTLSEVNRRATVVSDDLSLVLPGEGGALELVGSPFRGTYEAGEPVVGCFPLVAGFRIVKDERAEVRAVARARALAELVGNLPFVAEAFHERPDLFARIKDAFDSVPLSHLHFRKDESYWDAIARAGLTG